MRTRTGDDRRRRRPDELGSVVAEFAIALPAVAIVLALGVAALAGASRQVRLQDAVADAARLSARGEPAAHVTGAVVAAVAEASVEISARGELVCVTATAPALLGLRVSASGCALAGGL